MQLKVNSTCCALLAIAMCVAVSRADVPPPSPSMVGVRTVALTVYADGGIDEKLIERQAKQTLINAGIKVVDEPTSAPARLRLDAVVTCQETACGYRTRLWLEEPVKLLRNPGAIVKATTWSNGYGNAIKKSDLASLPPLMKVDIATLIQLFAAEVSGRMPSSR